MGHVGALRVAAGGAPRRSASRHCWLVLAAANEDALVEDGPHSNPLKGDAVGLQPRWEE